ncbi:MAG: zinc ribbon domain-containing protein [Oscillospiraceae bacterium]|nr:zinc ribbon domain-containing protein [Oscillospiraceae bacterium]
MPDEIKHFESYAKLLKEGGTTKIYDKKAEELAKAVKITPDETKSILAKAGIDVISYEASLPPMRSLAFPSFNSTIKVGFKQLQDGTRSGSGTDDKNTDLTKINDLYTFAAYVDNLGKADYKPEILSIEAAKYKKDSAKKLYDLLKQHEFDKANMANDYSNGWITLCSARINIFYKPEDDAVEKDPNKRKEKEQKAQLLRNAYDDYLDNNPVYEALKKDLKCDIDLAKAFGSKIPNIADYLIKKIESYKYNHEQSIALYNDLIGNTTPSLYYPDEAVSSFVCVNCRCGTLYRFANLNEAINKKCSGCGKPLYEECPQCKKQTIASKDFCTHCEFFLTGAKMFDFYYRVAASELEIDWKTAEHHFANAKAANPYRETELSSLERDIEEAKKEALQEEQKKEQEIARQKAIEEENKKAAKLRELQNKEPEPCGNLVVEKKDDCFNISWGASVAEYIEYKLIRKENSEPQNQNDGINIASGENLLNYSDKDIKPGIMYYYGVFAQRQNGGKCSAIETKSTVLLSKPLEVRYVEDSGRLTITWKKPKNCTEVKIKIGKTNNDVNAQEIYSGSDEIYVDPNLKSGERYAYGIIAVYKISGIERESEPCLFSYQLPSYVPCEFKHRGTRPDNSKITFEILNRDEVGDAADYIYYNIRKEDEPLSSETPINHRSLELKRGSSEIVFENENRKAKPKDKDRYLDGPCVVTVWVRYGKGKFSPPSEIEIDIPIRK